MSLTKMMILQCRNSNCLATQCVVIMTCRKKTGKVRRKLSGFLKPVLCPKVIRSSGHILNEVTQFLRAYCLGLKKNIESEGRFMDRARSSQIEHTMGDEMILREMTMTMTAICSMWGHYCFQSWKMSSSFDCIKMELHWCSQVELAIHPLLLGFWDIGDRTETKNRSIVNYDCLAAFFSLILFTAWVSLHVIPPQLSRDLIY